MSVPNINIIDEISNKASEEDELDPDVAPPK